MARSSRFPHAPVLVALGSLVAGCSSSYRVPAAPPPVASTARPEAPAPEVARMYNLYVLGFFGSKRTDVRDVCESGIAERIAIRTTWLTSLATVATLGLYSPLEEGFVCAPENAFTDEAPQ